MQCGPYTGGPSGCVVMLLHVIPPSEASFTWNMERLREISRFHILRNQYIIESAYFVCVVVRNTNVMRLFDFDPTAGPSHSPRSRRRA